MAVAGLDISTLVLWALVAVAAAWDVAQRRIPNPLIVVGLLLGAAFQAQGAVAAQTSVLLAVGLGVLGALTALAALFAPFFFRLMGGGDVKLAMVCGMFTGWSGVLQIVLMGTVIHGVLALLFVVARQAMTTMGRTIPERAMVPHAVGFAVSTFLYTTGIVTLW